MDFGKRRNPMPEILTYICPYCDTEVRVGGPCPGCAKKIVKFKPARKSRKRDHSTDGLSLPDDEFDYEDFIAREFGTAPHKKLGIKWYWWLIGIVALAGMAVVSFWIR